MSDYRRAHVPDGGVFILATHQRAEQSRATSSAYALSQCSAVGCIAAIVVRSADVSYGS